MLFIFLFMHMGISPLQGPIDRRAGGHIAHIRMIPMSR